MKARIVSYVLALAAFAPSCQRGEAGAGAAEDPTSVKDERSEPRVVDSIGISQGPPPVPEAPAAAAGAAVPGVIGVDGIAAFDKLPKSELERLRSARVFFGHQSVGGNLLGGAEALGFPFRTVSSAIDYAGVKRGEALVAENGNPSRKIRSFTDFIDHQGIGDKVDVAGFKFCWIDFAEGADIGKLESEYAAAIDAIAKRFPRLRLFHVTPPLTSDEPARNKLRLSFGERLKARYASKAVVLDLGSIVSTSATGSRCQRGGVPVLCDDLRSDSGHLSDVGSQRAAKAFLYALVRTLGGSGRSP
jgi:hypothetical protein